MPMSMTEIERALRQLRLSGMRATLDARSLQATQGDLSFLDAFSSLLQDELDRRTSRQIDRAFTLSGLPEERKTLQDFDWHFNSKVPKKECLELCALRFLRHGEDALLIGSPGTGKSHIALAVAHAAILAGHRVVYREAHEIFPELYQATQLGTRQKLMRHFTECDLLVLDDLFLRKLPADAPDELQEIVLNRYKRKKSTVVTTNRIADDWGKLLGDTVCAATILDRLMHRGNLLRFEGKSYRLKEAAARLAREKHSV